MIFIIGGLTLPWSPIILFEIITKGFLFRQWITHPDVGMKIAPSLINVQSLVNTVGIPLFCSVIIYIVLLWFGKARERLWLLISGCGLLFFIIVSKVPSHYLLGLTCLIFFTVVVMLSKRSWGRILLGSIILLFLINIFTTASPRPSIRSIGKIQTVVEKVIQSHAIDKTDKIAVIAALDLENKVPQADDYRFFLRIRGFTALEVTSYASANKMIMFVENPRFDWKSWSTWETEQMGSKRIISEQEVQGIKVITFKKN